MNFTKNYNDKIEQIKSMSVIDLAFFFGYGINKKKDQKNWRALKKEDKNTIFVKSSHPLSFFSTGNEKGSSVDFLLAQGLSWKEILNFSSPVNSSPVYHNKESPEIKIENLNALCKAKIDKFKVNRRNTFLTYNRKLTFATLENYQVRCNYKMAIFNHWMQINGEDKIISTLQYYFLDCNKTKKTYLKGGKRGLGVLTPKIFDNKTIIVCESSVDALSYAELHKTPKALLVFTGGSPGNSFFTEFCSLIRKIPNPNVILALDNDVSGELYCKELKEKCEEACVDFQIDTPKNKDWNDDLKNSPI